MSHTLYSTYALVGSGLVWSGRAGSVHYNLLTAAMAYVARRSQASDRAYVANTGTTGNDGGGDDDEHKFDSMLQRRLWWWCLLQPHDTAAAFVRFFIYFFVIE